MAGKQKKSGIKVAIPVEGASVEVTGGAKTIDSLDNLGAALVDMAAFLPRLGANYTNSLLTRQNERLKSIANKAAPYIREIPSEERRPVSDKIKQAVVVGAAVEDDPDIQNLWAKFLARAADGRCIEPDLILAGTIEKMTAKDLAFFQNLRKGLEDAKLQKIQVAREGLNFFTKQMTRSEFIGAHSSRLHDAVDQVGRDLVEGMPVVVSQLAKDHLLALGIIAPVSIIDGSTKYHLTQLPRIGNISRLHSEADILSALVTTGNKLNIAVEQITKAIEESGSQKFRLTNSGSKLFEMAVGVPLNQYLSVKIKDLMPADWQ